jgi:dienelactone hydrolase
MLAGACASTVSFPDAKLSDNDGAPQSVSGLLARPEGAGPFPAVVILHSCAGFTTHVTTDWPRYLKGLGYIVLSVDTFGSRGYDHCPNPLWRDFYTWTTDAYGALDFLAAQPYVDGSRVAVMGFSLGANVINGAIVPWRVRRSGGPDFKAAIAFYGRCDGIGSYPEGSIPLMEIAAENDPQHREACEVTARTTPGIVLHVIPGAYHAFDAAESSGKRGAIGEMMQYSASATETSRGLVKDFLERRLGTRAF